MVRSNPFACDASLPWLGPKTCFMSNPRNDSMIAPPNIHRRMLGLIGRHRPERGFSPLAFLALSPAPLHRELNAPSGATTYDAFAPRWPPRSKALCGTDCLQSSDSGVQLISSADGAGREWLACQCAGFYPSTYKGYPYLRAMQPTIVGRTLISYSGIEANSRSWETISHRAMNFALFWPR